MNLEDVIRDLSFWRTLREDSRKTKDLQSVLLDKLFKIAFFKYCRNEHDARDVSQEAFVKILQSPPESTEGIHSWLSTVVHSAAADFYRKRNRESQLAQQWHELRGQSERDGETLNPIIERDDPLGECVESLPEDLRSLVIARFVEGIQLQELAAAEGLKPSSLGFHSQKAITKLRECLKSKGFVWGVARKADQVQEPGMT